jgi:hypothetical protein
MLKTRPRSCQWHNRKKKIHYSPRTYIIKNKWTIMSQTST